MRDCQPPAGCGTVGGMSLSRLLAVSLTIVLAVFAGGCFSSKKKNHPVAVVRFMLEGTGRDAGGTVRLPKSGTVIQVAAKSQFSEYDIVNCTVVDNELGKSLAFELTSQAARDLYRMTATNQGKRIVTVLNGVPIGARRIEAPFNEGFILTYVEIDDQELTDLAKNITRTSEDAKKEIEKKRG